MSRHSWCPSSRSCLAVARQSPRSVGSDRFLHFALVTRKPFPTSSPQASKRFFAVAEQNRPAAAAGALAPIHAQPASAARSNQPFALAVVPMAFSLLLTWQIFAKFSSLASSCQELVESVNPPSSTSSNASAPCRDGRIHLDAAGPDPESVIALLLDAVRSDQHLFQEPAPQVLFKGSGRARSTSWYSYETTDRASGLAIVAARGTRTW